MHTQTYSLYVARRRAAKPCEVSASDTRQCRAGGPHSSRILSLLHNNASARARARAFESTPSLRAPADLARATAASQRCLIKSGFTTWAAALRAGAERVQRTVRRAHECRPVRSAAMAARVATGVRERAVKPQTRSVRHTRDSKSLDRPTRPCMANLGQRPRAPLRECRGLATAGIFCWRPGYATGQLSISSSSRGRAYSKVTGRSSHRHRCARVRVVCSVQRRGDHDDGHGLGHA